MYHLIRWLIRTWRSRRAAAQTQTQIQNQAPGAPTTADGPAADNAVADEPSAPARPARPAVRLVTTPPPVPTGSGRKISGSPALSVNGLTKRFGDRVAFQDLSFEVGHGEVFGFLGPNGAGKTTTVRTLGTLFAPTSGSASVAGLPLSPGNGAEIRRRISIMPESPGLYLRLSVAENLECFAGLYEVSDAGDHGRSGAWREQRAQRPHGRRLSRAVRAEEAEHLAVSDLE